MLKLHPIFVGLILAVELPLLGRRGLMVWDLALPFPAMGLLASFPFGRKESLTQTEW